MAGSDADGNIKGITAAGYLQSLYLTAADDINRPARDLQHIGILQFRPNPQSYISYDTDNTTALNHKVDEGMQVYAPQGRVSPGVHAITGFTHTMFVMGNGNWQSLEGGQFAEIDQHLAYIQDKYVKQGLLHFGTSSEMTREYLDYYTPSLIAVYGPEQQSGKGQFVYPLRLLGRHIPVDSRHIHTVSVKYPLYLRDHAYRVEIRKNNQTIMKTWGLPTPFNDVVFSVDDATAKYTLHVYADPWMKKIVDMARWIWGKVLALKK
jgi:hypothetical protein